MNEMDLKTKIEGLEKAITEHKDFSATYEDQLKKAQQELKDYNKPELTSSQMDDIYEAIETGVENFDFSGQKAALKKLAAANPKWGNFIADQVEKQLGYGKNYTDYDDFFSNALSNTAQVLAKTQLSFYCFFFIKANLKS